MVTELQSVASLVGTPRAVIVVSAHWEAEVISVTGSSKPSLYFDYYNFPSEAYEVEYSCSGYPSLANEIVEALASDSIPASIDSQRGLDHGVFVPMKIMYPDANIPTVQVSLNASLDPLLHLSVGKALQRLNQQNLLILGSGFSFHNIQKLLSPVREETPEANNAFEDWLQESIYVENRLDPVHQIHNWRGAPFAEYCHPREEHLLPLHVCVGLSGRKASYYQRVDIMAVQSSFFGWKI
jgi:4,5-DOPA dioxygenase extradiol